MMPLIATRRELDILKELVDFLAIPIKEAGAVVTHDPGGRVAPVS